MRLGIRTRLGSLLSVFALTASLLILVGCSASKIPGVYRLDIQQGNVITREMLDQLQLGMDRRKVRFLLGTPLLTDTFNQDRWDYLYSLQKGGSDRVQRHVSLFFDNNLLVRIEGDVRSGPAPEGAQPGNETIVTVPAERRKEGILAALIPDFVKRDPPRRSTAATPAAAAVASAPAAAIAAEPVRDANSSESQPQQMSAQDSAYLEKLFADFGKMYGDRRSSTIEIQPVAAREAASP